MCTMNLLDRMRYRLCEGGVGTSRQDVTQLLYCVVAGGHTDTLGVLKLGSYIIFWIITYLQRSILMG